jgi:two-component system response regulator YesN
MRHAGIVPFRPSDDKSVDLAIAYIGEHLKDSITADELSILFHISPKKLQHGFRKKTGKAVHDYIADRKAEYAKQLLADLDLPIKQICQKVGYVEGYFSPWFKKNTGLTPTQYRLRMQA